MPEIEACPCCGSRSIINRAERVQSNGIRVGAGRCFSCAFSWSTLNGRVSEKSAKNIEAHRRLRLTSCYRY